MDLPCNSVFANAHICNSLLKYDLKNVHCAQPLAAKSKHCLPQVLWRYKGKIPATLGSNTRLFDWIPQNDLLGKTWGQKTLCSQEAS